MSWPWNMEYFMLDLLFIRIKKVVEDVLESLAILIWICRDRILREAQKTDSRVTVVIFRMADFGFVCLAFCFEMFTSGTILQFSWWTSSVQKRKRGWTSQEEHRDIFCVHRGETNHCSTGFENNEGCEGWEEADGLLKRTEVLSLMVFWDSS